MQLLSKYLSHYLNLKDSWYMQFFEILFTLVALILLFLICFRGSNPHLQIRSFQLGLVIFLIHVIFETVRWQMLPSYLIFLLAALLILKSTKSWLFFRILGFLMGLVLIATSSFYATTMPINELPTPGGPYPVGTTNFTLLDESREETNTTDQTDSRTLFVEVWYPAHLNQDLDLPEANTLWQELYTGQIDQVSFFMDYLKGISTNSYPDIAQHRTNAPFPTILFNHGLQMFTAQNTILMEHLASHGYVMVSIGHPYESLRINLPGIGPVLPEFLTSFKKFKEGMDWIQRNSKHVISAMDSIDKTDAAEQKAQIMLAALEGSELNDVVSTWETDTRFVLDQLLAGNVKSLDCQNLIDSSRIGVMGMSIGGATATELCKSDSRIKAGINIDGIQYGNRNHVALKVPYMMIYSEDGSGSNEFLRISSQHDFHQYTFTGARHADFTDMAHIWPVMKIYGQLGSIPADRMTSISNTLILNFWNHYFKNRPLKSFSNDYPELRSEIELRNLPGGI